MENIHKNKTTIYQRCRYFWSDKANGTANIIRKVSRTLGLDLSRLSRGALIRPHRIKLWSANRNKNAERIGFSQGISQ